MGEGNSAKVTQYLFCFIFFLFARRSKHVDQVSSSSSDVTSFYTSLTSVHFFILQEDLLTRKSLEQTPKKCPSYIPGYIHACRARRKVTGVCAIEPQAMDGVDQHFTAAVITEDPQ